MTRRFYETRTHGIIKIVILLFHVAFLVFTLTPSFAGDLSIFNKTGFMDWREVKGSQQYVREGGLTDEIGVAYRDIYYGLEITPSASLWGAILNYDGSHAVSQTPWNTISKNIGAKGAIDFAVPIHLSDDISIAPTAGAGINYFERIIGPEYWTVLTAKAGIRGSYKKFTAAAGAMIPYNTTNRVDWRDVGMDNVVTVRPKGLFSPYAEFSYRFRKFEFGVFFEQTHWRESAQTPYSRAGSDMVIGAITKNGALYQPDTIVNHGGLSIAYHF